MSSAAIGSAGARSTAILCFVVAMAEGFDLQSAGVAAPRLARAMALTPGELAWFFTAATAGLVLGAVIGGRIADRVGRKAGLLLAVTAFGIASLAVAMATSYPVLLALRFATGIGLGGALPNLLAIAAESSVPGHTSRAVALTYAGMPAGGAAAALVAVLGAGGPWYAVFVVGGLAPLMLVPVLGRHLRPAAEPARGTGAAEPSVYAALFGEARAALTLGLWVGSFFSLLILHLLLNWLPALLVGKGVAARDAGIIQIVFNAMGALCSFGVGRAMDRFVGTRVAAIAFAALVAALVALALAPSAANPATFALTAAAAAFAGAMVVAVQTILYAVAPQLYPAAARGTGVGAAVAAGRLGSVAGPLLAGWLLSGGRTPASVLLSLVPIALAAGAAVVTTLARGGFSR